MGVEAIGGLFFRARDPEALSRWYKDVLEIGPGCDSTGAGQADQWCWNTAGGPVVFAPFQAGTDYFPADRQYMLNLRVSDLDDLLGRLRRAGVDVETRAEWDGEAGRFARIHDPEGNPIELWEMPGRLT